MPGARLTHRVKAKLSRLAAGAGGVGSGGRRRGRGRVYGWGWGRVGVRMRSSVPKALKMSLYDMTWEPKMLEAIMTKPRRMTSSSTTKTERSVMAWCRQRGREDADGLLRACKDVQGACMVHARTSKVRRCVHGACMVRSWCVQGACKVYARAWCAWCVHVPMACARVPLSRARSCCSWKYLIALIAIMRTVIASMTYEVR